MEEKKQRDNSISYIRVTAMLMILICHIANRLAVGAIAQLFQVGVQIFLFISGYLCAMRRPEKISKWLGNRAKRVFLPIWIFLLACLAFLLVKGESVWGALLIGTGTYGINHILTFISLPALSGFTHLWYIAPLLVSYLLMAVLFRVKKEGESDKERYLLLGGLFAAQLVLAIFKIRIDFIVVFFVGYCAYFFSQKQRKWWILVCNILAVVFVGVRVVMSGSESLSNSLVYLYYVIPLCYNFLGIALFFDMKWVFEKLPVHKAAWLEKTLLHIDAISYEVFIVHYIFVEGIWSTYSLVASPLLATLLFLALTFVVAEAVHLANVWLHKALFERRKKL